MGAAPHEYTEIACEITGGIATVTLDRPDRLNAFTTTMGREMIAAFAALDADDSVRVILVTGRGRAFCAGADLGAGGNTFNARAQPERAQQRAGLGTIGGAPRDLGGVVSLSIAACRKPVIGVINGPAVGVGVTMTLPMDIRIAADTARFGFVFARRGLVPEAASTWFLPRVVGISQAMEWVATGRVFGAGEALAGRLVSRVCPAADLLPAATAIAREICDNTSAVAVAASKQLLWSMLGAPSPWQAHALDSRAIFELGQGADVAEGVSSFLEKRPPRFPGQVGADYPAFLPPWPQRPDDLD
jgi:enoyl-CoA hydratase/carnithine racemase